MPGQRFHCYSRLVGKPLALNRVLASAMSLGNVSYGLNSLKGGYIGDYIGDYYTMAHVGMKTVGYGGY